MAVDGWWQSARLTDFIDNVSKVEGRMRAVGPFTSPEPGSSVGAFIAEMERRMGELFAEVSGAGAITAGDEPPGAGDDPGGAEDDPAPGPESRALPSGQGVD